MHIDDGQSVQIGAIAMVAYVSLMLSTFIGFFALYRQNQICRELDIKAYDWLGQSRAIRKI